MKRTRFNNYNRDVHKVGAHLGVTRLPLGPPNSEGNES